MKIQEIVLYFDGACEPTNPGGYGCYGFWIEVDGREVASGSGCLGRTHADRAMTNNVAEYAALIRGLATIREMQIDGKIESGPLVCRGDSKLVVEQVSERWRCNSPVLADLRDNARAILLTIGTSWRMEWIPREQNERADQLSRKAYPEAAA